MGYATIRVTRKTLEQLEALKKGMKAASIDEVLQRLIREYHSKLLEETFDVDAGKLKSFSEEDRLDARL